MLTILFITAISAGDLHATDISSAATEALAIAKPAIQVNDRQPWRKAQNKINRQNIRQVKQSNRKIRRMNKKSQKQRSNG